MTDGLEAASDERFAPWTRKPRVSVIVPHYNDLGNLKICLERLRKQTLAFEDIDIVVADNLSDCGLEAVKSVCGPGVRVILATTRGPGPARNAGVAAAASPLLAFTDTDCRPDPAWLEEGLKVLARYDVVGGAMGVTVEQEERPTPVECFETVFAFKNQVYVEQEGYTVTANMFTRREIFEAVGGFGSASIAEDAEWCRRVTRAGFRLGYAPAARVSHPARRDWPGLSRKWKRMLLHQFNEAQAGPRPRLNWLIFNFMVLLSPFVHIFAVLRSDRLKGWSQRLGAISVLLRLRFWRFAEGLALLAGRAPDDPWRQNA